MSDSPSTPLSKRTERTDRTLGATSPDVSGPERIRDLVREKYRAIARGERGGGGGCCGDDGSAAEEDSGRGEDPAPGVTSCDSDGSVSMIGDSYASVEGYAAEADLGLGCGLPTEHAGLAEGQAVVDLGSGAGLDAFVARSIVGERGRVVGVDFAPEMVAKARSNAADLGLGNVSFVEGAIEELPLEAESYDVALSNCVFNLVPDKSAAFRETYRVLRPGGHFCISDVVTRGTLPGPVRRSAELYAGCVAGAMDEERYLALVREAGFESVEVRERRRIALPDRALPDELTEEERSALDEAGIWSVTVRGERP